MKSIEIDDDLYAFIASQTKHIGESASQILRRLLLPEDGEVLHAVKTTSDAPDLTVVSTSSKPADNAVSQSTVSNTKGVSKNGKSQQTNATNKDEGITPVTASSQVAKSTSVAKAKPSVKAAGKPAEAKAIKETNTTSQTQSTESASADALSHDKNDILDLVSTSALSTFTKRVDQFLFVLSAAHKLNADNFERVESIKGKNRTYFATSKEALLENGSSTNPKAIPDSAYWVVTNNNTAKKVSMLEQVLRQLGYTSEIISSVVARFSSEGK